MSLRDYVIAQFKRPHGPVGHLAGWIMARRGSNRTRNLWTLDLLDIAPKDRVVEIGCGPGFALAACAARAAEGFVLGLDHSDSMLAQARRRNAAAIAAGRVALRLGGPEALRPEDGPFDKALMVNVLQFLDDWPGVFKALEAALAPGATLAVTFMPRSGNPTREAALRFGERTGLELRRAGYEDVRTKLLELAPVPAVCVLARRRIHARGAQDAA